MQPRPDLQDTGGYTPVNTLIAFSIAAVSSSVIVSPLKR